MKDHVHERIGFREIDEHGNAVQAVSPHVPETAGPPPRRLSVNPFIIALWVLDAGLLWVGIWAISTAAAALVGPAPAAVSISLNGPVHVHDVVERSLRAPGRRSAHGRASLLACHPVAKKAANRVVDTWLAASPKEQRSRLLETGCWSRALEHRGPEDALDVHPWLGDFCVDGPVESFVCCGILEGLLSTGKHGRSL